MKTVLRLDLCDDCVARYRKNRSAGYGLTDGSFCLDCTAKIVSQAKPVAKIFSSDNLKTVLKEMKFE